MSRADREMARGLIQKLELGRTPQEQRADFDAQFLELPVGDDPAGLPHQRGQEVELCPGQADLLLGEEDAASREVHAQVTDLEHGLAAGSVLRSVSHRDPDPGQ